MLTIIDTAVSHIEDDITADAMRTLYIITEHGNDDADALIIAAMQEGGTVPDACVAVLREYNPDLVNEDGTIPPLVRESIRDALDRHYLAMKGMSRHYEPDLMGLTLG